MAILKIVAQFFGSLFELFASERKPGLKNILYLLSLCFLMGLGAGGILYICLKALQHSPLVTLAACGTFAAVISGTLFLSKYFRCFILIFLISCGTQQGRNALITAGTSVVLYNCARNSFLNLRKLVESLECNLENMLPSVSDLLEKYIRVMYWIQEQIRHFPANHIVKFEDYLKIEHNIEDDALKRNLNATRINLEVLVNCIISRLDMISHICKSAMLIMGILLILVFTWFYTKRFLTNIKFENIYVTNQFLKFDEKQKEQGKPHLLQLTRNERKCFIKIPALYLSEKEWKFMARFCVPIFSNICIWTIIIMLDYGLFLLISSIRYHLDHLPPLNITTNFEFSAKINFISIPVNNYTSTETFSSETHLSKGNCITQPTLSITKIWFPLVVLIAALLLLTLFSAKFTILKVLVLSSFYAEMEKRRIEFLHEKILQKRSWVKLMSEDKVQYFTANRVSFWLPILRMKQNRSELLKRTKIHYQSSGEFRIEF